MGAVVSKLPFWKKRQQTILENGGSYADDEWSSLKASFNHRCVKCGSKEDHQHQLHADHVIPVTWGGSSDILNIQPLCRRCNLSKGNRNQIDYRKTFFVNHLDKFPDEQKQIIVRVRVRLMLAQLFLKEALDQGVLAEINEWGLPEPYRQQALDEALEWFK